MVLDFIEILKVIFLGIVEGITEWLHLQKLFLGRGFGCFLQFGLQ